MERQDAYILLIIQFNMYAIMMILMYLYMVIFGMTLEQATLLMKNYM